MEPALLDYLKERGVVIPAPHAILIGPEVRADRIARGVILHPGVRLHGSALTLLEGAEIGREGPAVLEDCVIGPQVQLQGGTYRKSVFLAKASMGPGAQVREGCLLEEEAGGAHTVGLKQTILFPFVTLGSLINFCDCLMTGGTSRKNHSEVGSSYIHFNFTPNQDKATASLIGDVPRGVMLRERPIFLGGQGGLVGPARIGFGSVLAAGIVWRGDLEENRLVCGVPAESKILEARPGVYREIRRRLIRNIEYIGSLVALREWYSFVRRAFLSVDLLQGALHVLDAGLAERLERLKGLAARMPESIQGFRTLEAREGSELILRQKEELHRFWDKAEAALRERIDRPGMEQKRDLFLGRMPPTTDPYIGFIQNLPDRAREAGIGWLQEIVEEIRRSAIEHLPSFR